MRSLRTFSTVTASMIEPMLRESRWETICAHVAHLGDLGLHELVCNALTMHRYFDSFVDDFEAMVEPLVALSEHEHLVLDLEHAIQQVVRRRQASVAGRGIMRLLDFEIVLVYELLNSIDAAVDVATIHSEFADAVRNQGIEVRESTFEVLLEASVHPAELVAALPLGSRGCLLLRGHSSEATVEILQLGHNVMMAVGLRNPLTVPCGPCQRRTIAVQHINSRITMAQNSVIRQGARIKGSGSVARLSVIA